MRSGSGKHTQWVEDRRFEEIDTDDDIGQGVGLDGVFSSDKLFFTGEDLGRQRRRYEYSSSSESSDYSETDRKDGELQVALRDKEELLVQKALERIRRAQMLGKKNVKLTQPEIDALERKRRKEEVLKDQASHRSSRSKSKGGDQRRSSGPSNLAIQGREPIKRKSKGYFSAYEAESSSASRRATPPGVLVPGSGVVGFSPLGQQPSGQGKSSPYGSRSPSSHNLTQVFPPASRGSKKRLSADAQNPTLLPPRSPVMSRQLPDDAEWTPRPRSASSASGQYHPYDPYQYQVYPPHSPQLPSHDSHHGQSRRVTSSPQAEIRYPRLRETAQPRSPEPSSLRREHSGYESPDDSDDAERFLSDDDEDEGVQVNVVPYGQGYEMDISSERIVRQRQRKGGR